MNVVMSYRISGRDGWSDKLDTGSTVEEWNAMTPVERQEVADDVLAQVIVCGFHAEDGSEVRV